MNVYIEQEVDLSFVGPLKKCSLVKFLLNMLTSLEFRHTSKIGYILPSSKMPAASSLAFCSNAFNISSGTGGGVGRWLPSTLNPFSSAI